MAGAGPSNRAVNAALKDADTLLPAQRVGGGLPSLARAKKGKLGFARSYFSPAKDGQMTCIMCLEAGVKTLLSDKKNSWQTAHV